MIFEPGDRVYILENHIKVSEVTVLSRSGDLYTVKFAGGGATRVRHSRLYKSEEDARKNVIPLAASGQTAPAQKKKYLSPYDYWC